MYYLKKNCPICGDGILGFLRCSDGKKVVIMCDECNSVWLAPDEVQEQNPIYPEAPEFLLPDSKLSVSGGESGWASFEEIESAGMGNYAAGSRNCRP